MRTENIRGASFAYEIVGDTGPIVVQLHGVTSSYQRDARVGLDLSRSVHDHRIIRFDARGHGDSTGTMRSADYHWDALAEDLLALLDRIVPGEKVHGLGTSMGAATVLHATVADPERFISLTLMTPPTAWKKRPAQAQRYRDIAAAVEREGMAAFDRIRHSAPVPPAIMGTPPPVATVSQNLIPVILRGAAETDLPAKKAIRHITAPALILAWTADRSHPIKTARTLCRLIPHSRLVIARNPRDVTGWPQDFAEHIAASERSAA